MNNTTQYIITQEYIIIIIELLKEVVNMLDFITYIIIFISVNLCFFLILQLVNLILKGAWR